MAEAGQKVEIDISSPRRRELVAMLCTALNEGLSLQVHWESGCELCHWQAASETFESLPQVIIETIFDEWSEVGERLDQIEFSGYLDTEDGHRAWGFIALRVDQPRVEGQPVIENVTVREEDGVYNLKATIRRTTRDSAQDRHV